jgi:hypothetical protein
MAWKENQEAFGAVGNKCLEAGLTMDVIEKRSCVD